MNLRAKRILLVSPNYWGKMHISKHHYALELAARGNQVFFLNPPSLKGPFLKSQRVNENLSLISYYPIFRAKKYLPAFIYNFLIYIQIRMIERVIGGNIDILWSFTSTIFFHLKWFNAKFRFYHPVDQLNGQDAVDIGREADLIFSCSNFIIAELTELQEKVHLIPHGLASHFLTSHNEDRSKDKIKVAYVGNLWMQQLDRELLRTLIEKNAEVDFEFFGAYLAEESNVSAWVTPASIDFIEFLKRSKNVQLHGAVDSNELPEFFKEVDLFLLAYKKDEINKISNSHKLLEYLSTGKTVLSTSVEEYESSGLIEIAKDQQQYMMKFQEIISNLERFNSKDEIEKRIQFARSRSYQNNILKIETILKDYIKKNKPA